MLKIAVFVSGRGSNLKAILNAVSAGELQIEISAVVSDKSDCPAFDIAKENQIDTFVVSSKISEGEGSYSKLIFELETRSVGLIVLAGFLKKIPDELIDIFENKIINIHPALLPAFGGKGMYGMNVHRAVFDKSVQVSGPTVHFVDKIYDNGRIIAQRAVDISDAQTPEDIAAAVLKEEHKILPFVIKKISEEKVQLKNNRIYIIR